MHSIKTLKSNKNGLLASAFLVLCKTAARPWSMKTQYLSCHITLQQFWPKEGLRKRKMVHEYLQ